MVSNKTYRRKNKKNKGTRRNKRTRRTRRNKRTRRTKRNKRNRRQYGGGSKDRPIYVSSITLGEFKGPEYRFQEYKPEGGFVPTGNLKADAKSFEDFIIEERKLTSLRADEPVPDDYSTIDAVDNTKNQLCEIKYTTKYRDDQPLEIHTNEKQIEYLKKGAVVKHEDAFWPKSSEGGFGPEPSNEGIFLIGTVDPITGKAKYILIPYTYFRRLFEPMSRQPLVELNEN